jgi:hypothetical protein
MTDKKKRFQDSLPPEDKRLYSVNFLLASFTPIDDLRHDEELLQNKLPSRHYQSRDFSVVRFSKHISTPLSQFPSVAGEDE